MSRERVVHATIGLERAKLLDGLGERVRNVTGLGGGVVTVTDVDLAVGLLIVADDEDEVVCEGGRGVVVRKWDVDRSRYRYWSWD